MTMMTTLRLQGVCTGWPSSLLCTRGRPNLTLFTTQHSATEAFKHLSAPTDLILYREELFSVDRIVVCEEKLYILLTSASFLMIRPSPSQAYLVVGRSVHCRKVCVRKILVAENFAVWGSVMYYPVFAHQSPSSHSHSGDLALDKDRSFALISRRRREYKVL